MRKVKLSLKKTLSILLIAGMALSSLTACSSINAKGMDEGKVVVLDNQQKEINDVLAIKQIIEVKDFVGFHWLEYNNILGVAIKDGIRNIAIYNVQDKTVKNITNNKDTKKGFEYWYEQMDCLGRYNLNENYVVFKERIISKGGEPEPYALLFYDIKEGKLIRIDEDVIRSQYIEDEQMYYAKGFKVYRYNMASKQKTEIQLPRELVSNLKDYFDSYEEYIEVHFGEEKEKLSEYWKEKHKEFYESEKENNYIKRLAVKGDELEIVSLNLKHYTLNMKTNTFKEGSIKRDYPYKDGVEIDGVAKVIQNKIPRELWKKDDEGNLVKMIDKTHDFVGGFQLSPDKSKLIYEAIYPIEERRKYIYDFKSDKKLTIFGDYKSICWNKESNKIVCTGAVYFYEELSCKIVILND
ncbi:hypothetical protein [Brassicibacter mesophilus]|uniref:hypothetical protein n=1 Tax=Brassicibacter mesophilus TaxID=745119 RepID=UPI003D194D6F